MRHILKQVLPKHYFSKLLLLIILSFITSLSGLHVFLFIPKGQKRSSNRPWWTFQSLWTLAATVSMCVSAIVGMFFQSMHELKHHCIWQQSELLAVELRASQNVTRDILRRICDSSKHSDAFPAIPLLSTAYSNEGKSLLPNTLRLKMTEQCTRCCWREGSSVLPKSASTQVREIVSSVKWSSFIILKCHKEQRYFRNGTGKFSETWIYFSLPK